MTNLKVENDFIEWCKSIHPDINPYIFINRHARYSGEYFSLLKASMKKLHKALSRKVPNIHFSFKGRVKSKRSFLIKSFRTMAENIEKLFPDSYPTDEASLELLNKERADAIEYYFKFLLNDASPNKKRFDQIKNMIENTSHSEGTLQGFRRCFDQLTPEEKENLVIRLGRTEDTFANRIIVNDVDFNVQSIQNNSDNQIEITDSSGNTIPISSAITIPLDKVMQDENTGVRYVIINGEKKEISEHNLLYADTLPAKKRTFDNALKNDKNEITLLQDSIVLNDKEHDKEHDKETSYNILSTFTDPKTGDIKAVINSNNLPINISYADDNDENNIINLSKALKNSNMKLKKVDSKYTEQALYDIQEAMIQYYDESHDKIGAERILKRSKNYVKNPKEGSNYKSLHDSFFYKFFGFSLETQIRNLEMEKTYANDTGGTYSEIYRASSHDNYKIEKSKKWYKNPILRPILEEDRDAFLSSTEVLEKLLYDDPTILGDLLPKYILTHDFKPEDKKEGVESLVLDIQDDETADILFKHIFKNPKAYTPKPDDPLPPLDFSSFESFIRSRKVRMDAISRGNFDIPLDYY